MSYNNLINQSGIQSQPERADEIDGVDEVTAYMELIKENIEYEHHMQFDEVVGILIEVVKIMTGHYKTQCPEVE